MKLFSYQKIFDKLLNMIVRSDRNCGFYHHKTVLFDIFRNLAGIVKSHRLSDHDNSFADFRITGGAYVQPGTEADIDSTPSEPTQIGSHTYNPNTIGTLKGTIEVDGVLAPYVGIGFGNAVAEDQLLTFMLDIGVIFQSYDVSLTSDGAGMTAALNTFREDVAKEEALLQKDVDDWKIFPVLTLGLAWHF